MKSRLMSDYEVTLVNDNSGFHRLPPALQILTYASVCARIPHPSKFLAMNVYLQRCSLIGKSSTCDLRAQRRVSIEPRLGP